MRSWRVLILVLLAGYLGLWASVYVGSEQVASVLMVVFIVGAGLAVDSIEHECAVAAASATLPVSLVALAALAAITGATGVALAAFAAMAVVVVTYWVSYSSARARC